MALKDYQENLRPYVFHGLLVNHTSGEAEATADCFICHKDDHLFINAEEGTYHCQRCSESGNIYTFLQKLYAMSVDAVEKELPPGNPNTSVILSEAKNLRPETLHEWGVVDSVLSGDPLIPGYNTNGKLATLYRVFLQGNKWKTLMTPRTKRHPFGWNLRNEQKEAYLCEGPWDAMTLYQLFKTFRRASHGKISRCQPGQGMINDIMVLGLSGVTHWSDELGQALPSKITLAFDNDHPQRHGQKTIQPGWDGAQRIAKLARKQNSSIEIHNLNWGKSVESPEDTDSPLTHNPDFHSGYDLSDLMTDYTPRDALHLILGMRAKVPKPPSTKGKSKSKPAIEEPPTLEPLPRTSYRELVKDYDSHLHFPQRLSDTLAVMLATVVSVQLDGIQIWLRIIGPPGSGKSTLAEAISADRNNIFPISHFTGLHSGYLEPGANHDDEDNSLIVKMHQRATIVKDADTLISNSQRNAILSEFRDVFDGTSRAHYRNKVTHEYEDIRTSLILCGTDELRILNRSALGERFLDLDILGPHTGESYVDRALRNTMSQVSRGFAQVDSLPSHPMDTDMVDLKRATMGYLHHLIANLSNTPMPTVTDKVSNKIKALAGFVSLARTKAKDHGKEDPTHRVRPELPTRISAQFKKLALCLAYTLNKKRVDSRVMDILRTIALDTGEGYQLEIIHQLFENYRMGMSVDEIATELRLSKSLMHKYLENMRQIGIADMRIISNGHPSGRKRHQWKLTKPFRIQYKLALK